MDISRSPALEARNLRSVLIFFGSSALFALSAAALAWRYLPYQQLERFSPTERFLLWEGVVWLLALLLTFLGLACILEVVGWRIRTAVQDLRRRFDADDRGAALISPDTAPWWMVTCGMLLILIATLARSLVEV